MDTFPTTLLVGKTFQTTHTHTHTHTHIHTHTNTNTHTYQFVQRIFSVLAAFQWTHLSAAIRHIKTQQYPVITLI